MQPVAAGSYGVFFVPGQPDWTLVLSKNSTSWGHYFYDESEDALRATVKSEKAPYREWLTWEFTERKPDAATLTLAWEELAVPVRIEVPDANELWYQGIARELRSSPGFDWTNWVEASQFLVQRKLHLDVAETWATKAASDPAVGQENFRSLSNLAQVQAANGKTAASDATMKKAVDHPTATIFDLHQAGRQLLGQGRTDKALQVFELNAKRHPNQWPVNVGLARASAMSGDSKKALTYANKAMAQAPDPQSKRNLETLIKQFEATTTAKN